MERYAGERYVTNTVKHSIPNWIVVLIWDMVDYLRLREELDYLLIFELKRDQIVFRQEIPERKLVVSLPKKIELNEKLYLISTMENQKEYSTLLLANEY